jgi:hypothetical protein
MADKPRGYRDKVTGRFARRPVEDIDAESRFDPMGDGIPFSDVSGAPSPSTIERPRHVPGGDTLAGTGPSYESSPLRARNPELVSEEDAAHAQGAVLRAAARASGPMDPTPYLVGLEAHRTPVNVVVDDGRA